MNLKEFDIVIRKTKGGKFFGFLVVGKKKELYRTYLAKSRPEDAFQEVLNHMNDTGDDIKDGMES